MRRGGREGEIGELGAREKEGRSRERERGKEDAPRSPDVELFVDEGPGFLGEETK